MYRNQYDEYKCCTHPLAAIKTKGRKEKLESDDFRTDFQRDIHRIIYSQAFRRLRHKTQVFYFPQNDHISTRLDHVNFVAQASRTVARCLGLNEDLTEAIALAHDIGHAPFGHQGENFLNAIIEKICKHNSDFKRIMPGFEHEVYGLRVVDKLAKRDRAKPGLNLTWEVRDGIISHCGEDFEKCKLEPGPLDKDLKAIHNKDQAGNPATLEGCVVRMVDKIAYLGKDIEDALEARVITVEEIPDRIAKLGTNNGEMVGNLIEDVIRSSYGKDYIAISHQNGGLMHEVIDFNNKYIYKTEKAEKYKSQASKSTQLLFDSLLNKLQHTEYFKNFNPQNPDEYNVYKQFCKFLDDMSNIYDEDTPDELVVLDFVAGMTDTFLLRSFEELFVPKPIV
ncbi:MAG: dNTP triphosphohydrolase [Planctomycetes bacterium]|nr:dNTP triphosphohydrolase [Planctomycetota bacterium]